MKVIQKKLDALFLKAGQHNRYQLIIVALFTFQFLCCQFFHVNYPYITSQPRIKVNVDGTETEVKLDSVACDKYVKDKDPISLIKQNSNQLASSTIIIDFDLACQTTKIYFFDIIYYLGNMIGSITAYHFYEKAGSRFSLNLFNLIQIISIFLLEFLNISTVEKNIYLLYVFLFIIGISQYIVVNLLFLYICDVVSLGQIPLFITTIICGRSFASLLGILFFEHFTLNWKHDMTIMAGVNLINFVIIFFYMEGSPKAALRNNKYMNFVKHLLKIARKNGRNLKKKDFDFLLPFMSVTERIEYEGFFNLFAKHNIKNNLLDDDNEKGENEESEDDEYKDLILKNNKENERKTVLKDEYLLSDENNKIGSVNTLFNKVRMRDYSFFDFFKFKSHLINFCVLSFLWTVYNFIKYGIQSTLNEIPKYYNNTYWRLIIHILELITLFLIMLLYIINQKSFNKILISIELIAFIILAISEYLDNTEIKESSYIISLLIARVIWNCLYLLLIIIALFIYPIMLRSKGLGWNIALGIFGKIVVTFVIDLADKHDYILYFLLVNFLMLVFSNRLPPRIGSLQIDFGKDDKDQKFSDKILKDDNNEEEDDINIIKDKNEMKII